MRVFLSWSGEYSRAVATLFADWIPCVLQQVDIFLSSNAIEAGDRWDDIISAALKEIDFGILFVTNENKEKPWLLFEAGALAKNIQRSKVVPILIDAKEIDFSNSPLLKFQYKDVSKEGIFGVMRSVYSVIDDPIIDRATLTKCLDKWWPELEEGLKAIKPPKKAKPKVKMSEDDRLERIETALSDVLGRMAKSNRNVSAQSQQKFFSDSGEDLVHLIQEVLSNEGFKNAKSFLKSLDDSDSDRLQMALKFVKTARNIRNRTMLIELIQEKIWDIELPF